MCFLAPAIVKSNFLRYNAQVNSFAPPIVRSALGVAATILECLFGVTLLLGIFTRLSAAGAGGLLFLFGGAMAVSFGIKSPFDYSVFSVMSGALLLAAWGVYSFSADALFQWCMRNRGFARMSSDYPQRRAAFRNGKQYERDQRFDEGRFRSDPSSWWTGSEDVRSQK